MNRNISTSTIVAKIKRLNIKGVSTKFYDELDTDFKAIIESCIDLLKNEQFVFCYYLNADNWWVITNLRLFVSENNIVDSYLFDSIKSVEAKDIFEAGVTNQECNKLQFTLQSGQEKNLNLENNTWFSVLNLLKFLLYKE